MKAKTELMSGHRKREAGMTMIELLIAMFVLAVGLGSLTVLFVNTTATDNKSSRDTSATLLAQLVLEQISAQSPVAPDAITLNDCANTVWTINNTPGAAPGGTGATLVQTPTTSPYYGAIDQTQDYTAVPAGYAMRYADCGPGGRQDVYDVRWNVMTISPYARLITVSARQSGTDPKQLGGRLFAFPVTLRGIGGM